MAKDKPTTTVAPTSPQNIAGLSIQLQINQAQFDVINQQFVLVNAKLDRILKAIEDTGKLASVTATLKKSEDVLSSTIEHTQP